MSMYENLVMQTQMNYSRYHRIYAAGKTAVKLSGRKPLPYREQIQEFVKRVQEAECIVVGGASGLSAAGGGDFYYADTPSFRKYFGKYAEKYGFKGAFDGMYSKFDSDEEHWGFIATFLNTTLNAPVREPYLDLDKMFCSLDAIQADENGNASELPFPGKEEYSPGSQMLEKESAAYLSQLENRNETLADQAQLCHTQYPVLQAVGNLYLNKQILFQCF
ncbi:MAG: hypothetical protein Q4E89_13560 [Eubacteriales bacterium]|nr:hypothetical protein [Eubacteriales bacterium]